jgi:hypothetical protein
MADQISIDLKVMTDKDDKTYYAAFPDLPFNLKLDECVFFVFVSEEGQEALVIKRRTK